jgi:biopolymer transport protein TolR
MGASIQTGGGHGGGRRGRRSRRMPMSDINVTPLVDVMLVLLIVFMVTAPLLTVGVPIELPKTEASALKTDKEPLTVTVKPDGKLYLMETEVAVEEIEAKLMAIAKNGKEETIFVRGDRRSNYGELMRVMGRINRAGFHKISLITELEQEDKR